MSALRLLLPVLAVLVWRSCCALDTESSPVQSPPAPESLRSNPCSSSGSSCGECLRQPQCAWCTQQDFPRGFERCAPENLLVDSGCSQEAIENPQSRMIQETPLDKAGSDVQLQPGKVRLALRQGAPQTFTVRYRQADDYPVDLYYLMDLTHSMKDHRDKVAELADDMVASMLNVTRNFRLGFGSFIDKVVMPYVDTTPARLQNPCHDTQCAPPYGFHHQLPLTTNSRLFTETVSSAALSGNLDNAEGGFDAIMQSIVCKEKIGWNERSRKILLFATDSIFHAAGDGLLGGIVRRNDEECHLDQDGFYSESSDQDYPSLSQIVSVVQRSKINLIFAVPEGAYDVYRQLSAFIDGSSVGKLVGDSSNIVHLVRDQYYKIRSEVVLKDNAPWFLRVNYSSKCLSGTEAKNKHQTNACGGIRVGDEVEFQVSVELVNCPADASSHVFRISPVGVNEYVEVQVEPICSCDCEAPQRTETNSSRCNGRGSSACGVCSCDPNFYGKQCECLDTELQLHKALCQASNSSTELCSNRGDCVCGECQCYNPQGGGRVFGQWCQCDSFSCERDAESRVCGGPERGQCCGGECQCNSGWGGSACDCSADTSTCVAPGDPAGRMCGGHGDCVCGACRCRADAGGRYSGPFCQDCAACVGRCSEFRSCVQCTMFGSGEQSEKCRSECSKLNIVPVDKAEEAGPEERKCIFKDVDDCSFSFVYYYDENNEPVIEAQKTKECGKEALTWYIVGGVVGGIVIFGLLAVCIGRFLLYLKDKLEYEKFVKERKNAAWRLEMNPIFKEPVSEYRNPMYETGQPSTAGLSSSRS
uniref:Integrin beta n=1 Tax=Ixodes scapularis TaxID=6945 RepID=A0A4D5RY81_IXOSC